MSPFLVSMFSGLCLALSLLISASAQEVNPLARATKLNAEVRQHIRDGRYAEGIPKAKEALAIRERVLDANHPAVAESLNNLAELLRRSGDYRGAQPLYERALKIREEKLGPNHSAVAITLNGLAGVLGATGDFAGARPLYERALKIREQAVGPDHPEVATILDNLGDLLFRSGEFETAKSLHERALKIRQEKLGLNHGSVALTLNNLARVLRELGDYSAARPLYERALKIREENLGPDHPQVAVTLSGLAEVLRRTANYPAAKSLSERALKIREQTFGATHPSVAESLNNLAPIFEALGDYSAARTLYERALKMREQTVGPDHPGVAAILNNLAFLLLRTGDYTAARPLMERALKIQEQALGADHAAVAASLNNLAVLHQRVGDIKAAKSLYERALKIREQALGPNHPLVAITLNGLAGVLRVTKDYTAARSLLERALKIREQALGADHPAVAESLNNLALLLQATRDYRAALPLYERVLAIRERSLGPNHPAVGMTLGGLAFLLRVRGDYAKAKPLYERALQIARSVAAPELRWRAALGLGLIHEREKRLTEAAPLYQEAVKTLEGLAGQFEEEEARTQYWQAENRLVAYDALARLLLKLHEQDSGKGYDRDAWAVLEAKKGRVVAEALSAARPKMQDPHARAEAEKAQAKLDQALALEEALLEEKAKPQKEQQAEKIQNLTTLLAQTKAGYLTQVKAFLTRYPQYKTQFVDQQTVDPKALAKFADRLPADTLAVQYFAAPETLYLFIVAPGGKFQVKSQAVSQADLYALVKQYRQHLEQGATQRLAWTDDGSEAYRGEVMPLKELTQKLARHLLGAIEAELKVHRNLILIPNDLLLYLPIHALARQQPDGSVRFLAETHSVSYITQLELLDLLNPVKPTSVASLLAFSNPDGSLPAASREVREVRRIRQTVTTLDGPDATKATFLKLVSQFDDLHLATHGVLDPKQPERSYLLFAGDGEANQRLGVAEIAGLSLRSGLVILSACETALGEQVPGAALITLAAAFSQAGSQSTLASLWKVNDASTRDFMVAFYRALPTAGRAGALQQAQLAVLKNPMTAHPYYWAAFILMGAR